jgi:hypothetical protein
MLGSTVWYPGIDDDALEIAKQGGHDPHGGRDFRSRGPLTGQKLPLRQAAAKLTFAIAA